MDNDRTLTERTTYRPDEIAADLWGADRAFEGGKRIRNFLRANVARTPEQKGTAWILDPEAAERVFAIFANATVTEAAIVELDDLDPATDSDA
jgi:hypothetical protein